MSKNGWTPTVWSKYTGHVRLVREMPLGEYGDAAIPLELYTGPLIVWKPAQKAARHDTSLPAKGLVLKQLRLALIREKDEGATIGDPLGCRSFGL